MTASRKPTKPVKKPSARTASPRKAAKPARRSAAKAATAGSDEAATDLVYSDIRRSMHGAILRHLR